MEYLKEIGFNDDDIKEVFENNYQHIIDNLIINKDNILEIARYLLEIGIQLETIKEIFMYQVGLFFKTKKEIQASFDEYEIDSIVKSLNYDVNNVELIDFI